MCNKGFTLIELLVVVLIIGILASIAVPKYFKIIEQTRAAEALTNIRSLKEAHERYYQTKGTYPSKWEEIDLVIPATKTGASSFHDAKMNDKFEYRINPGGIAIEKLEVGKKYFIYYTSEGYFELGGGYAEDLNGRFLCGPRTEKYDYICQNLGGVKHSTGYYVIK